ncbi:glycosyltransferase [Candidatus Pacearchaeota archaeon]|nr:glycosyltransferase [Candidatus Pacearchaeota archaeon]
MKKVAIIIPIHATKKNNRLKYFNETLNSVKIQDYPNLVTLVVDDGSEDKVKNTIKKMSDTKVIRREKSANELNTASIAQNYGIDYIFSSSKFNDVEYITFLHSDDMLFSNTSISDRINLFKRGDKIYGKQKTGLVFTDMIRFSNNKKNKKLVKRDYSYKMTLADNQLVNDIQRIRRNIWVKSRKGIVPYLTQVYRKKILIEVHKNLGYNNYSKYGFFDSQLNTAEDKEAALQCLKTCELKQYGIITSNMITVMYRVHKNSSSWFTKKILKNKVREKNGKRIANRHLSNHNKIKKELLYRERLSRGWIYNGNQNLLKKSLEYAWNIYSKINPKLSI